MNVPSDAYGSCETRSADRNASRVVDGLDFTVQITSRNPGEKVDLGRFGTAAQILDRIASLGPDPADWTTQVLEP